MSKYHSPPNDSTLTLDDLSWPCAKIMAPNQARSEYALAFHRVTLHARSVLGPVRWGYVGALAATHRKCSVRYWKWQRHDMGNSGEIDASQVQAGSRSPLCRGQG
jgi:hypothetical protein